MGWWSVLPNWLYPRENKLISLWQEVILEQGVELLPSHRNWEIGADYISKRWLPGPCERHFWFVKLTRGLFRFQKDYIHLRGTEKEFAIINFLMKCSERKGVGKRIFPFWYQGIFFFFLISIYPYNTLGLLHMVLDRE